MPLKDFLENSSVAQGVANLGSLFRYGVPFDEKEAMAIRGEIPGYDPKNGSSDLGQKIEQRRAAAYLWGKTHPQYGPDSQPFIDLFRRVVEHDDPRLLAVTQDAAEKGSQDTLTAEAAREEVSNKMGQMTLRSILNGTWHPRSGA